MMQVGSVGGTYPNPRLLSNHTAKTPNNASKSAPSKLVFVNSIQASIHAMHVPCRHVFIFIRPKFLTPNPVPNLSTET